MRFGPVLLLLAACSGDPSNDKSDSDDTQVVLDTDRTDTDTTSDTDVEGPVLSCPAGTAHSVLTTTGCVVGQATASGQSFLGIPYAMPPVGGRRWKRPEPIAPWTEPLTADDPGDVCPQTHDSLTGELSAFDGEEDCLRLNVVRPDGASGLPVLFFIHGGGNVDGAGSESLYLSSPGLAENAILVTHNYRLGPLGWLAHPALSAEDPEGVSGNQGLRDSLMALRWVHDNAAAFGGDPNKILLFGESAGSIDTCALWLSPEAQGLFAAAIGQSGPCSSIRGKLGPSTTPGSGEALGEDLAVEAGCDTKTDVLGCLRSQSVFDVLRYLPGRQGPLADGEDYGPVIDGKIIPYSPKQAVNGGHIPNVPLLLTVNADEGSLFLPEGTIADDGDYLYALLPFSFVFPATRAELHDAWDPVDYNNDPNEAYRAFITDALFLCPARKWLRDVAPSAPAYGMYFARPLFGADPLGAFHGAELPYVFGKVPAIAAQEDKDLSTALVDAWVSMASGTPVVAGVDTWSKITDGWVQVGADAGISTIADLKPEKCAVLGL